MLHKKEFTQRLAAKGYTLKDAETITGDFIKTLEEIMVEGGSVQFRGFGTFSAVERKPRRAQNVNTGEKFTIPAFRAPKFVAGRELKQSVRDGEARG